MGSECVQHNSDSSVNAHALCCMLPLTFEDLLSCVKSGVLCIQASLGLRTPFSGSNCILSQNIITWNQFSPGINGELVLELRSDALCDLSTWSTWSSSKERQKGYLPGGAPSLAFQKGPRRVVGRPTTLPSLMGDDHIWKRPKEATGFPPATFCNRVEKAIRKAELRAQGGEFWKQFAKEWNLF